MPAAALEGLSLAQFRAFYAEEIGAVAHVVSPRLVNAFAQVERDRFLGPPPWQIAGESMLDSSSYRVTSDPRDVYHNVVVALKSQLSLNNGQPSALAIWIAALNLASGDRVLHIGCGSGYYSAIMAEMVGSEGKVVAVEIDPDLAAQAAANLAGYVNVTVHCGDGAAIEPGLCDAILMNAGVTHPHPMWLSSMKESAALVLPLTVPMMPRLGKGLMIKITREGSYFPAQVLSMVAIYSSSSIRDPDCEIQLNKAFESRELLKLKSVRRDMHEKVDTCLVHSKALCLSSAGPEGHSVTEMR